MNSLPFNPLAIFQLANKSTLIIIFCILGGLGTFLYGMSMMSQSLNSLAGSKLKSFVSKATSNIFKGFLIGILITILIQSSSATTVIVIGLISAGLLDLKHAMPIMIGAHIGTTVLAYIVSINVSQYCLPLIFIGAFIVMMVESRKLKLTGRICLGIGFIFLGLEFMSISFGSFAKEQWFVDILTTLGNNNALSFLTGLLLTALIQSSGAFIAIVQEIYATPESAMTMASAIALILGSNIGTSVTALIASISGNRLAKQAAIANTLLVAFGALVFLPFAGLLAKLFELIQSSMFGERSMLTLAFFHTFFNSINSVMALSLISPALFIVQKILPYNDRYSISAEKLNKDLLKNPSLALDAAKVSIIEMGDLVQIMYDRSVEYFNENSIKYFEEIQELEDKVDNCEHLVHDYLMQINEIHLNKRDGLRQTEYIDIIRDLERIGDHCVNFSEFIQRYYEEKKMMSDAMKLALNQFFETVRLQIEETVSAYKTHDVEKCHSVIKREETVDEMEKEYRLNVHSYIRPGEVSQLDILYIDIVSNLERVSDHTTNICELILDPHMVTTISESVEKE